MGGIARGRLFGALGVVGAVAVGTRAEQLFATTAQPASSLDRPATIARVQASRLNPPPPTRHGWQDSSIGHSVEGRSIVMWTRRATRERAHVLVIGAIHGNEPVTRPIAEATADVTLPVGTTLSIIPTANPDGGVGPRDGGAHARHPDDPTQPRGVDTSATQLHRPDPRLPVGICGCLRRGDEHTAAAAARSARWRRDLDRPRRGCAVDARGSRIVEVDRGDGRATSEGLRALRRRSGRIYRAPLNTVPPGLTWDSPSSSQWGSQFGHGSRLDP